MRAESVGPSVDDFHSPCYVASVPSVVNPKSTAMPCWSVAARVHLENSRTRDMSPLTSVVLGVLLACGISEAFTPPTSSDHEGTYQLPTLLFSPIKIRSLQKANVAPAKMTRRPHSKALYVTRCRCNSEHSGASIRAETTSSVAPKHSELSLANGLFIRTNNPLATLNWTWKKPFKKRSSLFVFYLFFYSRCFLFEESPLEVSTNCKTLGHKE